MKDHKHCIDCGKMLPETQTICVKCVSERAMQPKKEPYYISFVKEVSEK